MIRRELDLKLSRMSRTELQDLVLQILDKQSTIADSRDLTIDGNSVDQLALLGVLNSLGGKKA